MPAAGTATPVRFDVPVADRLASFVAANPGMSLSSAANRLVDEALHTGTPARLIRVAITYWASYPDEIDAEITAASNAEAAAEHAWRRERDLLVG
jgi:hypothetical protein